MTTTTTETAAKKNVAKLQRAIVDGLEDVKGQDIQVFNTEHLSPLFERVVVASGTSNRQTKALAASVIDKVREAGFPKPRVEGEENGEWIIVDCGAAVAHVMQPAIRQYYRLEDLWGEMPVRMKLGAAKPVAPAKKAAAKKAAAKTTEAKAPAKAPAKTAAKKAPAKAVAKPAAKTSRKPAAKTAGAAAGSAARKTAPRAAAKPKATADSVPVQKLVVKPRKAAAPAKPGAAAKAPARKVAAAKPTAKPAAKTSTKSAAKR